MSLCLRLGSQPGVEHPGRLLAAQLSRNRLSLAWVQWALRVHEVSGQLRGRPSKGQPLQQIEAEAFPRPVSPGSGCAKACTVGQLAKLMACIGLDVFGDATYLMPGVGETADLGYAPLQGIALQMLFRSYSISGIGFLEARMMHRFEPKLVWRSLQGALAFHGLRANSHHRMDD
eukprot:g11561.t1